MDKTIFRNVLLLVLAVSLSHISVRQVFAGPQQEKDTKVKAAVAKRGVGEKAKIKVTLQNKTEVKAQTGEGNFVVTDAKTGAKSTITYRDVARVHGKGLPLAAKIGIVVGALAVAIGTVILAASKSIESAF